MATYIGLHQSFPTGAEAEVDRLLTSDKYLLSELRTTTLSPISELASTLLPLQIPES